MKTLVAKWLLHVKEMKKLVRLSNIYPINTESIEGSIFMEIVLHFDSSATAS